MLVISKLGLDQFDADDQRLLEVLAGHASVAFVNARLYEAARREAEGARALLELSRELSSGVRLDDVVESIARGAARILGVRRASVWLPESDRDDADIICRGTWAEPGTVGTARVGDRLPAAAGVAFTRNSEPFVLERATYEPVVGKHFPGALANAYALAPIRLDNGWGALTVALDDRVELDDRDLGVLSAITGQAKLALANALSFESLERTFLSTVEALANALEAKDEYTSTHARWIRDMAVRVGVELGLDAMCPEARRARGAVPRHRQDRDPVGNPLEARPSHPRRARDHRDTPRTRRADPGTDRSAGARAPDRASLPRAVRRHGIPRRALR